MDLIVKFMVLESGAVVEKKFDSYLECRKFVNKMRHSRKCRLICYPNFYD